MTERGATGSASRADLLELRREHEVVEEGHRFLDEKRVLLARELLHRLDHCEVLERELREMEQSAHRTLIDATTEVGLEELQLYPPRDASGLDRTTASERFLGLQLPAARLTGSVSATPIRSPAIPRAAADRTADAFAPLFAAALELASEQSALFRLEAEYRKTQRRVRALEKIMLPELRAAERSLEAALEELEIEEAVRVRMAVRESRNRFTDERG